MVTNSEICSNNFHIDLGNQIATSSILIEHKKKALSTSNPI